MCVLVCDILKRPSTLVAEGIHHEHLARGGSSSGSAGNRRVEMNCRRRSTSCLKRLGDSLRHTHAREKIFVSSELHRSCSHEKRPGGNSSPSTSSGAPGGGDGVYMFDDITTYSSHTFLFPVVCVSDYLFHMFHVSIWERSHTQRLERGGALKKYLAAEQTDLPPQQTNNQTPPLAPPLSP